MWSDFPVPDVSLWAEKLQKEATKTLGPEADATSGLRWKSPHGLTYEPLYRRTAQTHPSVAAGPPLKTRPRTRIELTSGAAAAVSEALGHECQDFSVKVCSPEESQALQALQAQFPEARWLVSGPMASGQSIEWDVHGQLPHLLDDFTGSLVLSTVGLRQRGATIETELWMGLSALVHLYQSPRKFSIGWATGLSPQILLETAKCRAIRRLWQKFSAALGITTPLALHGVQSDFYTARVDEPSNMLRSAAAAWTACLTGCETVLLEPYSGDPRAARVARNQLFVFQAEGYLDRVADPLAGAYAIEDWTEKLARSAWNRMREQEARGGLSTLMWSDFLDADYRKQLAEVDQDRLPIVGVTRYVQAEGELNLGRGRLIRLAASYEQLREKLAGRSAVFLALGSPAKLAARIDFARGFLAIGGITGEVVAVGEELPELTASVVVLCGSDSAYSDWVPRVQAILKPDQQLVVAGKPGLPGSHLEIHRGASRIDILLRLAQ